MTPEPPPDNPASALFDVINTILRKYIGDNPSRRVAVAEMLEELAHELMAESEPPVRRMMRTAG